MTEAGGRGGQTPGDDRQNAAELRGHPSEPTEAGGPEQYVDDARRYRLGSRIATGGMGEVWRGTDTVLGRDVAVKLLKAEYADHPTFRSRFETEARHAAALHHPNVAQIFDVGEADAGDGSDVARPYLVMELVDGQPLSALLGPGRPLDPGATRDLLAQAADALGAAHAAGIVHRDVKPANLLVTPDRTVKITDFGIARATEGMALTETGQVMGTPQYLSPEQAQGGTATPASDVYSLGVVAFECLAGRRPYVAETAVATALAHLREPVPDLPAEVPADLAAVVRKAMAKSPEDRYPDADAFAAALRDPGAAHAAILAAGAGAAAAAAAAVPGDAATQVLTGVGAPAPAAATASTPVAGTPAHADRRRRGAWPWVLLALVAVAAVIAVALLANGLGDDDPAPPPSEPSRSKTKAPKPTESATEEPTQSDTPTPTETQTSETPSETPTPTETPSETPSETPTPTPTDTASESPVTQGTTTPQPSKSPTGQQPTAALRTTGEGAAG